MSRLTANLDSIANRIRQTFSAKDAAREKVFPSAARRFVTAETPSALSIARNLTRLKIA